MPVDDERLCGIAAPTWLSEVFESDGYDSETLGILLTWSRKVVLETAARRIGHSTGRRSTGRGIVSDDVGAPWY
jgi:hypothetical protein